MDLIKTNVFSATLPTALNTTMLTGKGHLLTYTLKKEILPGMHRVACNRPTLPHGSSYKFAVWSSATLLKIAVMHVLHAPKAQVEDHSPCHPCRHGAAVPALCKAPAIQHWVHLGVIIFLRDID